MLRRGPHSNYFNLTSQKIKKGLSEVTQTKGVALFDRYLISYIADKLNIPFETLRKWKA